MENIKELPKVGGNLVTLEEYLSLVEELELIFRELDEKALIKEARKLGEYYAFLSDGSPPTDRFPEIIWHCLLGIN